MTLSKLFFAVTLIFTCGLSNAFGQGSNGTKFWVSFIENGDGNGIGSSFKLNICAPTGANVLIECPAAAISQTVVVAAGDCEEIVLPSAVQNEIPGIIAGKAVKITSDNEISVKSATLFLATSDATEVYPEEALGEKYFVSCFDSLATTEFAIVGTKCNSQIEITPTSDTDDGHLQGVPYTIVLNEGDVYFTHSALGGSGLAGTKIECINHQKIALFSGNIVGVVGGCPAGDHMYSQDIPVKYWGDEFVTMPSYQRNSDLFLVIASEDNTTVLFNGINPIILNEGEFAYYNFDLATHIQGDKPIQLCKIWTGSDCFQVGNTTMGDPLMLHYNSLDKTSDFELFEAYSLNLWFLSPASYYHMNVLVETANVPTMLLDGNSISANFNVVPAFPSYSYATLHLTAGVHDIAGTAFQAYLYTYANDDSYGYSLGNSSDYGIIDSIPQFLSNDTTICQGESLQLLASGSYQYSWSPSQYLDVDTIMNPIATPDSTIDFILIHDDLICESDTVTVTVVQSDSASFDLPQASFCVGDLDPTPTITGTPGGTFTMDNGGVIDANTGSIDLSASGAGTYTITYTTNSNCPDSVNSVLTITSGMDATITAVGPFCANDPAINSAAVDGGGTWSGTGITDANLGTFDPAIAGVGVHTITYTIPGGCGDTDTEDYVVNGLDNASFAYLQTTFCVAETDPTPTISGLAGGNFSIDGTGVIDPLTGEIDLDASGVGSYVVTYQTNGPCPATGTFNLAITNTLDATIFAAGPYCENDAAINLTAVDGGGTWSGTGIIDANSGAFDPSVAGAGVHSITYTISGACGASDNVSITVNAGDVAAFSYPQSVYCVSDLNPYPSLTGTLGGTFTIDNGGAINTNNGEIDLLASGAGTFTVTYTTSGICPDVASMLITVSNSGSATITPAGPYCIEDAAMTLSASSSGGTWTGTGITDSALGTFDPNIAGAGTHQIIYSTSGVCTDADTIDIVVYDTPILTISPSTTINWGESTPLLASGAISYNWSPSNNLDCSNCSDPTASPTETTTYCVTGHNGTCSSTVCTTITIDFNCGEVFVPTVFTPSSGDANAMECVLGGCIVNMHFRIYDRWGELIFETFDQGICWDGTHKRNGQMMSTGVYVYMLDATSADGSQINKTGNISLIR